MAERKKLGELLIEGGLIDQYQLKSALAHQRQWGGRIGANVVKLGFITEDELVSFLSRTFNLPSVNLHTVKVPATIIGAIPKDVVKKYGIIPLQQSADKKQITIAMSDPTNLQALDELQFLVNARINPVISSDVGIEEALHHYYDQTARMDFEIGAKSSVDVDFSKTSIKAAPAKRAAQATVAGKIDIQSDADNTDVVIAGELDEDQGEPQPDFSALGTDGGLDDVLVFSGGAETTISIDGRRGEPARPAAAEPERKAAPASAASKKESAPTTDQLMMALVRVLIDKGLLTKEELLARLK
jgi:type IV pilus assembly protein PilB